MPDWHERIKRETAPATRVEHELRYGAAAPAIRAAATWCDLGCGHGSAAAAALGGAYDGVALLVDVDEHAVAQSAHAIEAREVVPLVADLTDPAGIELVRTRLAELPAEGRCITCFEAIEHLPDFAPLIALLTELADNGCTVVLSVPNEAFWAIENPHHPTSWGEGAVAELRSLLPAGHRLLHQLPLHGSALVGEDAAVEEVASVAIAGERVPSHFLIAFGVGAELVAAGPRVAPADLAAQRSWQRQRESDLAYAEARIAELEARVRELEAAAGPGADAGDAA